MDLMPHDVIKGDDGRWRYHENNVAVLMILMFGCGIFFGIIGTHLYYVFIG